MGAPITWNPPKDTEYKSSEPIMKDTILQTRYGVGCFIQVSYGKFQFVVVDTPGIFNRTSEKTIDWQFNTPLSHSNYKIALGSSYEPVSIASKEELADAIINLGK